MVGLKYASDAQLARIDVPIVELDELGPTLIDCPLDALYGLVVGSCAKPFVVSFQLVRASNFCGPVTARVLLRFTERSLYRVVIWQPRGAWRRRRLTIESSVSMLE